MHLKLYSFIKGEFIMETITFMTSLLTFYLKGEIKHEQNFIKFKVPNTILSIIPLGAQNETIPINQISSVGTNFHLLFKNFVIGIIVTLIAFACFGDSVLLGLILLFIGVSMVINSFQSILTVNMTSGNALYISFLIFEKSKAKQTEYYINQLISNRLDDTNNRQQTDRIIDAINNK